MFEKSDFEVGQKVVIRNHNRWMQPYRFDTVARVTETQVIMQNSGRFMLRTGDEYGEAGRGDFIARNWTKGGLVTIEEAERENVRWQTVKEKKTMAQRLREIDLNEISDDDFVAVKSILEKYLKEA